MKTFRKPEWLHKKTQVGQLSDVAQLSNELKLHTVCKEAACPNRGECFSARQATFLILGNACTRACSFCKVDKETPLPPDNDEPRRVALAIRRLGLSYAVITSPTRDDLPDGGAEFFSRTVLLIREQNPHTGVEILVPDFLGNEESIAKVLHSVPTVFSHNLETVRRLYPVRKGADYDRSLGVLRLSKEMRPDIPTKSAIMLGLGETEAEVLELFGHLRAVGCDYLAIGQYLQPSRMHTAVVEFVTPMQFEKYRVEALQMGFGHVESAPYVRSSYLAERYNIKE